MRKRFSPEATLLLFSASTLLLIFLALIIKRGDDVYFINSCHTVALDAFFSFVTTLGEGFLFVPIIIYFLFIQFRYAILSAMICAGHSVLCAFIKRNLFAHVGRPIAVLDKSQLHFIPNMEVHGLYSFPSGHTATIFCIAMLMSLMVKRKMPAVIFLIIALLVGYSRIYLAQHFLIDVAGGAFIGTTLTYGFWKIFDRDNMPRWMNGSLAAPLASLNKALLPRKKNRKPAGA